MVKRKLVRIKVRCKVDKRGQEKIKEGSEVIKGKSVVIRVIRVDKRQFREST